MKEDTIIEITDDLVKEAKEIVDELIKEEVMPLLKRQEEQDKALFDKAYKELIELEEEV